METKENKSKIPIVPIVAIIVVVIACSVYFVQNRKSKERVFTNSSNLTATVVSTSSGFTKYANFDIPAKKKDNQNAVMIQKGDIPKKGDKYNLEIRRNKDNTKVRYIFTKKGYASYEYSRTHQNSGSGETTFQKKKVKGGKVAVFTVKNPPVYNGVSGVFEAEASRTNKNSSVPKVGTKYCYSWTTKAKDKNSKIVKWKYWRANDDSKHVEFISEYTLKYAD